MFIRGEAGKPGRGGHRPVVGRRHCQVVEIERVFEAQLDPRGGGVGEPLRPLSSLSIPAAPRQNTPEAASQQLGPR